ncbi:hypothetical protein M409DRAFT_24253 [Zasmidium cellare ATCC 36951]|uniref:Uncharacterized protein n=1 Tax=Zasmidium cellare ATCC 36951 TaxID=1080233 RepID=A0A6A6CFI0_ZASCE|nr:uncharacterized protein M409DRAFT_24253 [Zasmidium cellare ATCC 36951]KAF2165403.1 hypothetical protein M409DRAFT_24253 [Zasmidium cellare ATCC 36951]
MTDADPTSSFASSPPVPRVKSPPLAFERTPNDVLLAPTDTGNSTGGSLGSPSNIGRASPLTPGSMHEQHLQILVDQQANAIQLLHEAFGAERQAWSLEKERLYQRIASLEQLLKTGDHWSPAKSPIMSPSGVGEIVSPTARAVAANPSLPTIVEHENVQPLSSRRENAPPSIDLPSISGLPDEESRRQSVVTFTNEDGLQVQEIPPRNSVLSPPPPLNRMHAGHTPIRAPRPPTPPPQNMSMDGIEDTPTRNNTHINTLLSQSNDEDEDVELKGPLNMPELPNNPDETNFTLDMLSKKLEKIQSNPEEGKPMVFAQPSPGLASPASELDSKDISPNSKAKRDEEAPYAPIGTHQPHSQLSSNALSPTTSNVLPISPQEAHEAQVQAEFEQGGIRLKKKTSVNFGAPFGSLGFAPRRSSQDKS